MSTSSLLFDISTTTLLMIERGNFSRIDILDILDGQTNFTNTILVLLFPFPEIARILPT